MSTDDPKTTPEARLEEAHFVIIEAGFVSKHTSPSGSRYYHLPGRTGGMLRLSGHSMEKPAGVAAMLTIHSACLPRTSQKLREVVARAIGHYMLRTTAKKTDHIIIEREMIDGAHFFTSPTLPGMCAAHIDLATAAKDVGEQMAAILTEVSAP